MLILNIMALMLVFVSMKLMRNMSLFQLMFTKMQECCCTSRKDHADNEH
ncbi:hypothetical protein MDMS009_806 [Methylophaga thiooxydans DMS010]|uniref:Uncharacterized protein n=1 Tax=Methylophaga thiooxydans DMS010 TaxID=637616 RepID=C0N446_9GAMM|nr:hypothetical protein MDMS009_806 [Methylophaga thiooxydans DMS010]